MHVCMYLYGFVCVGMLMCAVPMHMFVYVCGDQTLSTVHLVFIILRQALLGLGLLRKVRQGGHQTLWLFLPPQCAITASCFPLSSED